MEVKVPECTKEFPETSNRKSEVLILPVSLQDESSITGVSSIIEELSQILGIPMPEPENYLLFDPVKLSFDIEDARKRFIFLKSMEAHKIEHENILREHELRDKAFASALEVDHDDIADESTDTDEMNTVPATSKRHLQELRKEIKDKESAFKTAYTNLKQQIAHASLSTDLGTMNLFVNNLKDKKDEKVMVTDQYERTFLHQAVEENNVTVSRVLLQIGCNPNAQEGCGATPLTLAVLRNSTDLCKLLVDHLASPEGVFVNKIPSPMKIATCLGYNHILDGFEKHCRKEATMNKPLKMIQVKMRIWLKSLVNLNVMMIVQQVRLSVKTTVHSLCLVMLQQQRTSVQQDGTTCQGSLPFLKYLEISIALGILKNVMPKHRDLEACIMQLIRF